MQNEGIHFTFYKWCHFCIMQHGTVLHHHYRYHHYIKLWFAFLRFLLPFRETLHSNMWHESYEIFSGEVAFIFTLWLNVNVIISILGIQRCLFIWHFSYSIKAMEHAVTSTEVIIIILIQKTGKLGTWAKNKEKAGINNKYRKIEN